MRPKYALRAAAVLMFLWAAGHTSGSPWTPSEEVPGLAVIAAMKAYRFDVIGFERSYFDFYEGFAWGLSAYLFGHAVLFWQLADLSTLIASKLRFIVAVLCLESLCATLVTWKFFFWIPVAVSTSVAVCLALASVQLWRADVPAPA